MTLGADRGSVPDSLPAALVTEVDFADWLRPHMSALTAVARREVGPDQADDVVQDAILQAWRHRARYDPERGSPRTWLMAILFDKARRHRRRYRLVNRIAASQDVVDDHDDEGSLDRGLVLDAAVSRLSRRQREVVVLHYVADLPVSDVARLLGLSESSVKTHLQHARSALRTYLIGDSHGR